MLVRLLTILALSASLASANPVFLSPSAQKSICENLRNLRTKSPPFPLPDLRP
ncbi:MAG: hypothetical protein OSA48_06215 [Akkermansiaceae bacterium]|nr:hypothetical protein [Akkermansiaceae bacterium]